MRPDKQKFYAGDIPEEFILNEGDLIVAMTEQGPGLLGSSALIPRNDAFLHNQRLGLVDRIDPSVFDKRFLYYLFNTRSIRQQISGSASGTKVRHTAPERIYRVKAGVPDPKTQSDIAARLWNYDSLIENNRRRIQLLEQSARMLYKEWFVRLRFPGHEHVRIRNGVPEGWEKRKLKSLAAVNKQSLPSSFEGEIRYIDIASVTPGSINQVTHYDIKDAPSRARRILEHGDIIWSCVRPNRRSHVIIWKPDGNLIASTGFAVISPTNVPTTFLYQSITTDAFAGHLENRGRGAAYPAVVAQDFEDAEVMVPYSNLMTMFDDAVQPTLDQVYNLRAQNERLRHARDFLLPKLISGEIQV